MHTADAKDKDLLFFVADKPGVAAAVLGQLRLKVADHLKLLKSDVFEFCWVLDFPYFHWSDEEPTVLKNPVVPTGFVLLIQEAESSQNLKSSSRWCSLGS